MTISNDINFNGVQTFDAQAVKQTISQIVILTTRQMLQAVIQAKTDNITTLELGNRHINFQIENELTNSDAKTQMVFQKLLLDTNTMVQNNCPPLMTMFIALNDNIVNGAPLFLSSFVLPNTKTLVEILDPQALDVAELWT